VEIFYVKTWYTVPETSGHISFTCLDCADLSNMTEASALAFTTSMRVQPGYYETVDEVVLAINDALEMKLKIEDSNQPIRIPQYALPRFMYDRVQDKVCVYMHPGYSLKFDDHLASMIGFDIGSVLNITDTSRVICGPRTADINGGIRALYVYCDVLENVAVGDTLAPLLRIVDATAGRRGENVHQNFDPPRYMPVRKKKFDTIEMLIKDEYGEDIAFEGGKSVVTLHFRRAANPYFT